MNFQGIMFQVWQLVDSNPPVLRSGATLAARLVDRGFRQEIEPTQDELRECEVGDCVKTGVTAWERIK